MTTEPTTEPTTELTTELLYLRDAYLREFDARVVAIQGAEVALDRTAFYPTGGGQPHDTGTLGLLIDPLLRDLRPDPRYKRLLAKLGLPDTQ